MLGDRSGREFALQVINGSANDTDRRDAIAIIGYTGNPSDTFLLKQIASSISRPYSDRLAAREALAELSVTRLLPLRRIAFLPVLQLWAKVRLSPPFQRLASFADARTRPLVLGFALAALAAWRVLIVLAFLWWPLFIAATIALFRGVPGRIQPRNARVVALTSLVLYSILFAWAKLSMPDGPLIVVILSACPPFLAALAAENLMTALYAIWPPVLLWSLALVSTVLSPHGGDAGLALAFIVPVFSALALAAVFGACLGFSGRFLWKRSRLDLNANSI